MNNLQSQINASDRPTVMEHNLQLLDTSLAFMLTPSLDLSVSPPATTIVLGPPTAGTYVKDALWVDAAYAVWRCTVGGTPGTWQQERPAVCSVDPVAPPDGYVIARVAEYLKLYRWNAGGAAWVAV